MLRIFRINDPYRLILAFLLIISLELPIIINANVQSVLDLKHHIIGEKLNEDTSLYSGLWDNISPLSAWTYMVVDSIFGKSKTAYFIISIMVFFFQAGLFNIILIKKRVYNENTYIPALFYTLFGFMFFDTVSLSPQLLGLTFILFSLNSLFNHLELNRKNDINLINLGIYVGLAALFYLPYLIYLISITLGLLLYTNTIKRRYLLMYYGAFFMFLLIWMLYFMKGDSNYLFQNLVYPLFNLNYKNYLSFYSLFYITLIPAIFLILSIFKTFQSLGYSNYQVRIQSLFFLFLIFQGLSWVLWSQKSGASLIVFVPIFAFFITHFFLQIRSKLQRSIYFYLLLAAIITMNFYPLFEFNFLKDKIDLSNTLVRDINGWDTTNKPILVIGDELSYYKENSLATPFLNWDISKKYFNDIDDYGNILTIYNNFRPDYPEYIIDPYGVFPNLIKYIPELERNYLPEGNNIYKRTNN